MNEKEAKREVKLLLNDPRYKGYDFLLGFDLSYKMIYILINVDYYYIGYEDSGRELVCRFVKDHHSESEKIDGMILYFRNNRYMIHHDPIDLGFESIDDAYNKLHEVKVFLELMR